MVDFTKCNYISGFYTSTDKIENFKFRVTIKEVNKNILLTKSNISSEELCQDLEAENLGYHEEKVFRWQEKVPMLCSNAPDRDEEVSEIAESGHEENEIKTQSSNKLISYIDCDEYEAKYKLTTNPREEFKSLKEVKNVSLNKAHGDDSSGSSENNGAGHVDEYQKMFIVAHMNSNDRNQKVLQNGPENLLLSLIWQPNEKCLTVSPDFNDIKNNPYIFERHHDSKKLFHYSIEQIVEHTDDAKLTEMDFLQKISQYENEHRTRKLFHIFPLPPRNVLKCTIITEIISAYLFEYDNLYVEYTVEIPDGYKCNDRLKGTTQISKTKGSKRSAHFGHLFELSMDYLMDNIKDGCSLQNPQIYFEIISCDARERHRTEGYCHVPIQIARPGSRRIILNAFNPRGANRILWSMNRFFIGGSRTLKDIASTAVPDVAQGECLVKGGMDCISTGKLDLSMKVVLQSASFVDCGEKRISEKLNAVSLFESVNAVLSAYTDAKRKFKASLQKIGTGADGDETLSEQ